ncbi:MAG TPA: VOC family protein [Gammaproteobacteria bacterium]|nr:VOC family protein [Gammaproteobacteria bacterium]
MQIQAYLFFNGRCEEALEFYEKTLGTRRGRFLRYQDSPEPPPPGSVLPGFENKVIFTEFTVGDTQVMACDDCTGASSEFKGFRLSLSVSDEAEARRVFSALADGGEVHMPLARTFFSPSFGMLRDKFGVGWMVIVPAEA